MPEPDAAVQSISIDATGKCMAAINNKVQLINFIFSRFLAIFLFPYFPVCRDCFNNVCVVILFKKNWSFVMLRFHLCAINVRCIPVWINTRDEDYRNLITIYSAYEHVNYN